MTSLPASDGAGVIALRTSGSTLIELPFRVGPDQYPWVASTWPALGPGISWAREVWHYGQTRRGWTIPASCIHGTVIELGIATRRRPARTVIAWYGVALTHDEHWLVCTNPFPRPDEAYRHVSGITDRFRQAIISRHRTTTTQS